jgi:hypothetical protein
VPADAGNILLEPGLAILSPAYRLPGIFHSRRERCFSGPLLSVSKDGRGSGCDWASAVYSIINLDSPEPLSKNYSQLVLCQILGISRDAL